MSEKPPRGAAGQHHSTDQVSNIGFSGNEVFNRLDAIDAQLASICGALERIAWRTATPRVALANDREIVIDLYDGHFVCVPAAQTRHALSWLFPSFEWSMRLFIAKNVRPGMAVVDIGANIGALAAIAARCVGPSGLVVTVEPIAECASFIRKNIELNAAATPHIHYLCAAGRLDEPLLLQIHEDTRISTLFPYEASPIGGRMHQDHVMVRRAATLVPEGPQELFIKIDAEGAETDVLVSLFGNLDDLRARGATIVFEHAAEHLRRAGKPDDAILRLLEENGLTAQFIRTADGEFGDAYIDDTLPTSGNVAIVIPRAPRS